MDPLPAPEPSPAPDDDLLTQKFSPSLMHGLLAAGAQTQGKQEWLPPSVEDLQRLLPQYEISEFLARGGMGAVYKGVQKTLKRPVAIKVLPPEADDGDLQYAERFKREAQAMARLSHPNIVAVYDAGEVVMRQGAGSGEQGGKGSAPGRALDPSSAAARSDGPDADQDDAGGAGTSRRLTEQPPYPTLLYFVMEFIEGTDLHQVIASEGQIDARRAVTIITAVCDALAFAHEEGIIHRDIKPSNIMLDRKGRVKVADFGLAKSVHIESTMLTRSDMAMGTPDFVAPEALISGMALDQRADLYAVGVMLYQMLTGKIPRGRFDSPSQIVPKMDKSLDAIVDKAMQTDRDKRYSTASELKRDVEKVAAKVMKGGREDTLAREKRNAAERSAQGSADSLRGFAALVRPDSPGGGAATTTEAGRLRSRVANARAPLLIAAAVVVLGLGAWFVMVRKGGEESPRGPISSSPTLPISQSSAPEPAAIKLWDSPEKINALAGKREWRDGALFISGSGLKWQENASRDGIFRASFRRNADTKYPNLSLRCGSGDKTKGVQAQSYKLVMLDPYTVRLCIAPLIASDGKGDKILGDWKLPAASADHEWVCLELQARGPELTVVADGVVLGKVIDTTLPDAGTFQIAGTNSYFKDIEYEVLDGVEGAKAGTVGTGTSPSMKTTEVWHDWITEQRRAGTLDPKSWEPQGAHIRALKDAQVEWGEPLSRDAAARATWTLDSGGAGVVQVRRTVSADGRLIGAYTAGFSATTVGLALRTADSPPETKTLGSWPVPKGFDAQREHTVELRAVGDQLTVLFDGQEMGTMRDTTLPGPGRFAFWAKKDTRVSKIEYQNLDDAEAAQATTKPAPVSSTPRLPVSIPGLPDLPPLTIPPGEPGLVKEFDLGGGFVHGVKLLPDSRRMLVLRSGESLQLYDLEKQTAVWTVDTKGKLLNSCDFSQDGSRFVIYGQIATPGALPNTPATKEARITLRRSSDGTVIQEWIVPVSINGSNDNYVALTPSGKRLAARVKSTGGGVDQTTFIGLEEGKDQPLVEWDAPGHNGHTTLALDEDRFLSTGNGAPVTFRFSRPGTVEKTLGESGILGSALSPDRRWLIAHDGDSDSVAVWDMQSEKRLPFFERSRTRTIARGFAGNDLAVVIRESKNPADQRACVWDRGSGDQIAEFAPPKAGQIFRGGNRFTTAPNGRFCVLGIDRDKPTNTLQIWRLPQPGAKPKAAGNGLPVVKVSGLPDLPPMTIPPGEPGPVKRLASGGTFLGDFRLLPDSRRILLFQGRAVLLDLERESPVWAVPLEKNLAATALSSDGSRFAVCTKKESGGNDRRHTVILRRTSDGSIIRQWPVEIQVNAAGNGLALSPTGKRVLVRLANPNGPGTTAELVAFDADQPEPVAKWSLADFGIQASLGLDEDHFICAGYNTGLSVLDVRKPGTTLDKLSPRNFARADLTPDQRWVAGQVDGKLLIWDMEQKKLSAPFDPAIEADQLQTAGNDLFLTTGGSKEPPAAKHLDVWDRRQGKRVATFPSPAGFTILGGLDGAANGTFAVMRLKPAAPGVPDDNMIDIYRLPKSSGNPTR